MAETLIEYLSECDVIFVKQRPQTLHLAFLTVVTYPILSLLNRYKIIVIIIIIITAFVICESWKRVLMLYRSICKNGDHL